MRVVGAGPVENTTEHLFEVRATRRSTRARQRSAPARTLTRSARVARSARLATLRAAGHPGVATEAPLGRHIHVGAQRLPDGPRGLPVGEGLHHGAVAQGTEHVVAG